MNKLTPMLNVADLEEAMSWYESVGFQVLRTNHHWAPDEPLNWCMLELEENRLMLNLNPQRVTCGLVLSLTVADVDQRFAGLGEQVTVQLPPGDRFYERRDFEISDPNGNGLLFGQNT